MPQQINRSNRIIFTVHRLSPVLLLTAFIVAFSLLACPTAQARVFFPGVKPLAMGTAFAAVADDCNAIQFNPAGIAQHELYWIDVNYQRTEFLVPPLGGPDEYKEIWDLWHLAIVDSATTNPVAAGLSFTGIDFPNHTFKENEDYRVYLAVAGNFFDTVYIGVNYQYVRLQEEDDAFTGDAGVLVRPIPWIGVGVASHHILGPTYDDPLLYRDIVFGIAGHIMEYATITFDVTKDFDVDADKTYMFAVGAEGVVFKRLGLRGGYLWDEIQELDFYSVGIGWYADTGTIGYSFRGNVERSRTFDHSIEISVQF